jgi:CxxC motif-containing protein (DUF1111 family)
MVLRVSGGRHKAGLVGLGLIALALGGAGALGRPSTASAPYAPDGSAAQGEALFLTEFTPEQGLGPLYNARSCVTCHNSPTVGGMATESTGVVARVARAGDDGVDLLIGRGGPIARAHSVAELGHGCALVAGIPPEANLVSVRNAPQLFGMGLIDSIPDEVILAGAGPKGEGIHGRPNPVTAADGTQRVGRFGWKADTASLEVFVAEAMRNELGVTSPLAPFDSLPAHTPGSAPCAGEVETADGATVVAALSAYVGSLPAPAPRQAAKNARGAAAFARAGCADCHTPALHANGREVGLYSDLLLHDMGPDLDDGLPQGEAGGSDWRTTPLWGLGNRSRLLHDARARTVEAAVAAHGGEATSARNQFRDLPETDRAALLAFLSSL